MRIIVEKRRGEKRKRTSEFAQKKRKEQKRQVNGKEYVEPVCRRAAVGNNFCYWLILIWQSLINGFSAKAKGPIMLAAVELNLSPRELGIDSIISQRLMVLFSRAGIVSLPFLLGFVQAKFDILRG